MFDTSNPILSSRRFAHSSGLETATLGSTINRCAVVLLLVFASAAFAWASPGVIGTGLFAKSALFSVLALIFAVVAMFKAEWSAVLAPLYAVMEGLSLGLWSMLFEIVYPGIVFQAVLLTFGVAFGMLLLYKTRIVRVTERFQMVIAAALFGIAAFYLVSFVLSIFGIHVSALTISGGIFGIAFNVFVVVIAALSLACDFDFIVKISDRGLPKYLSWLAALGLAVGLVYLYVNILRLLARFRER